MSGILDVPFRFGRRRCIDSDLGDRGRHGGRLLLDGAAGVRRRACLGPLLTRREQCDGEEREDRDGTHAYEHSNCHTAISNPPAGIRDGGVVSPAGDKLAVAHCPSAAVGGGAPSSPCHDPRSPRRRPRLNAVIDVA